MSELYAAVDALLAKARDGGDLPEPVERERLRKAAGLTQVEVAAALETRRETFAKWESGAAQPRSPKRGAYAFLLAGLADIHGTQGPDGWLTLARKARPLGTGSTTETAEGE
ncbi:helix-turn-helix domain-containing protein [Streptomyces sp. TLI_171]|uniref:helix-turn-helix domain-containing protein n=1 Tax=Streptomyces sp. TLI_171 TaxID=1938859 RepID=UPI000C19F383|nr:helix-turn-helix domain-containing protein [Streptomyces sp. TLI_171]RKE16787.1 helix-turn-helix protein [Streptomyces sp. TLI_171]